MAAIDSIPLLSGAILLFGAMAYLIIVPFTIKATNGQLRSIGQAQNEAQQNRQYLVHPVSLRDPHSAIGFIITVAFFSFLTLAFLISQSNPELSGGAALSAAEILVFIWVSSTLLYVVYLVEGKDPIFFVSANGIELRKYGINGRFLSRTLPWNDIQRIDTGETESGMIVIHIYGNGGQRINLLSNWINIDHLYRDMLRSASWGIYSASAYKHMSKHAARPEDGMDIRAAPIPAISEIELWEKSFPPKG
jgi:hypothetical protein